MRDLLGQGGLVVSSTGTSAGTPGPSVTKRGKQGNKLLLFVKGQEREGKWHTMDYTMNCKGGGGRRSSKKGRGLACLVTTKNKQQREAKCKQTNRQWWWWWIDDGDDVMDDVMVADK